MRRRISILVTALALLAPGAALAQDHDHAGELGSVAFPVTCSAEAQAHMHRAVAMLHSFWFPEARTTFEAAAAADPGCGIAYWGVAMTHFGNPMAGGSGAPGQAAGWEAAQRGATAGARSARDQAYVDAAVTLFRDHATRPNRDRMQAYTAALGEIVERFPEDTEAKIFHGIFLVATSSPTDLTFAQQRRAAQGLIALFREQPQHPGLAHYIIHAFDSPPLAGNALEAARQYLDIAPAAPHALHMPSHIFTRLGYWDESISSNRRSADLEPTPGAKSHPLDYLVYAYLQQGRDALAAEAMQEIGGATDGEYIAGTLGGYNALAMSARYALERDDWAGAARLRVLPTAPPAEAVTHFARGLGAARSGDVTAARAEVSELERLVAALTAQDDPYWPVVVDAQRMAVLAWIAHAEGDHAEALYQARMAAEKEETVEKHPVTPGPLIPARELFGDLLAEHGDPGGALAAYEATLAREPNRARTLVGAARAARAAGRPELARRYYGALVEIMDPGSDRPELREANRYLAG
ncbi:MAG: tetratricopeptide repeat protein [Gemmatimonadales bacterium]